MADTNKDRQEKKMGFGKKVVILVLVLAVAFTGFYFVSSASKGEALVLFNGKEKENYETLDMGSMVVNLKDHGLSRYLRISPILQYTKNSKLTEELNAKKHLLEDSMITCLRNKTFSEVREVEGVEELKEDLRHIINSNLSEGEIQDIYFVEYLLN